MCLMLYVATMSDQPCFESDLLNIEDVEAQRDAVRQWLTLPVIRFVGAHTGFSCGFRSIKASEPWSTTMGCSRTRTCGTTRRRRGFSIESPRCRGDSGARSGKRPHAGSRILAP